MKSKIKKVVSNSNNANYEDDKILEMFEKSFRELLLKSEEKVAMDEIEFSLERDVSVDVKYGSDIKIKITVYGLAGNITRAQFHDKKSGLIIKGFKNVDTNPFSFVFKDSYDLNSNDYVIVYEII